MAYILGVEVMKKLEGMDLSMLSKYMEEHTKGNETYQPKQPYQKESIDSPSTPRPSQRSRKKSITITSKNVEHGT